MEQSKEHLDGQRTAIAEWLDVRDGGRLLYDPHFLARDAADALFAWLQAHVEWEQKVIRGKPAPRLNAWFADEGLAYRYSGLTHLGAGWRPELLEVKRRVKEESGTTFNSLLLNRYRDGRDSISYHSDAEPELGENPAVATVSLGSTRKFQLRHRQAKETLNYHVTHGSLLVMAGTSQHHWVHGVPKTTENVGERISLTFRLIRRAGDSR